MDEKRLLWVRVEKYRAYNTKLPNGFAFTGTFCDECYKLYSVTIGVHKEANLSHCSTVGHGSLAALVPDRTPVVDYGLA